MGREKREPYKSPDSVTDAFRDIPLHQLANIHKKNTEENRRALLNSSVPEEMPIHTDWTSQLKKKQTGEKIEENIEDTRDLQRKRDLVEVLRIITTRFQGGPVTPEEYEWALDICKEEQELEDKELAEVMISMKPGEQDDSNIKEQTIRRAISSLEYDTAPFTRPPWLTGLNKPLPHPDLTDLQDLTVATRLYTDDLERLIALRRRRTPPANQDPRGDRTFEHYGRTKEMWKREASTNNKAKMLARGIWSWVVDGVVMERELHEYPVGLDGEPLGWGTRELEEEDGERRLKDMRFLEKD